eukprot:10060668-Alexandrium_andersonii.AAC.1
MSASLVGSEMCIRDRPSVAAMALRPRSNTDDLVAAQAQDAFAHQATPRVVQLATPRIFAIRTLVP